MDNFVKRYIQIISSIIFLGIVYWVISLDFRASELNDLLARQPELAAYPYTFDVISLKNGVATISSPRSANVPATLVLTVLFPELKTFDIQSDAMQDAQKNLAYIQSKVAKTVLEQEDVKRVAWQLDTRWLENHGIRY